MWKSFLTAAAVTTAVVAVPVGYRVMSRPLVQPAPLNPADVAEGNVLFKHEWKKNDPLASTGDGLGPVFNAESCVACHKQGGIGGGGGIEHNVTTFATRAFIGNEAKFRSGVLHAFAISPEYQENLSHVDHTLGTGCRPTLEQVNRLVKDRGFLDRGLEISQRQTPALFGSGLIDAIPDDVIIQQERAQSARHGLLPGGSETIPVGRIARNGNKIGRFGWKGQTDSLLTFVENACANELGLSNPGAAQPISMAKVDYKGKGFDLTRKQCEQIAAFCAALPAPKERLPEDPTERQQAVHGKAMFEKVGCASCHVPNMGSVQGIYSDLLLHRMGIELVGGNSGYIPSPELPDDPSTPFPDEWRTPPLWGVADSGPYMHDGRAKTLDEAIRLHRGQGTLAANNYQQLSGSDREALLAFLRTLKAPAE
jgi:CxxC motif-containing protein (DUF1111 family)